MLKKILFELCLVWDAQQTNKLPQGGNSEEKSGLEMDVRIIYILMQWKLQG